MVFTAEVPEAAWRSTQRGQQSKRRGVQLSQMLHAPHLFKQLGASEVSAPVYAWDFGDGVSMGTTMPTIGHDFGPHLDPTRERCVFTVKATVTRKGFAPIKLFHTVSVLNVYATAKRRGLIQPPVESDLNARFNEGAFTARLRVRNYEAEKLVLSTQLVEIFFEDANRSSMMLPSKRVEVILAADDITEVDVAVIAADVPEDAVGFAVHYAGKRRNSALFLSLGYLGRSSTAPGRQIASAPVRVSAYFDIPARRHPTPLSAGPLQSFLTSIAARRLVGNPRSIPFREIKSLLARGLVQAPQLNEQVDGNIDIGALAKVVGTVRRSPSMTRMGGHMEPPTAIEGAECDPSNLPSDLPEDFVCQVSNEPWRWVAMPGRFMNAKKGDVVLSPGDNGLIGELLRQVNPPQNYSHSGIMTRNHDEITHSTASPARVEAYPEGGGQPTEGFEPNALKYLWPGVITQTVENAVEGEWFTDPEDENGKTYQITSFNPDVSPGPTELIAALVVKPDPFQETQQIRQQLSEVAKFAHLQAGKSHYRFFCYTDPTIGLTDKAPNSAGWASGTFPTVCSSFIWMCVQQSGAQFEQALEEKDITLGAEPPTKAEGLYRYSAAERLAAGEWLYNTIYQDVLEEAGDAGNFATDVADDIANQFLNTFASDWSDTEAKDSDAWKNTTDADAVSPDNILWWDGPEDDGLYGYSEPLIYRPPRMEFVPVHRWKIVEDAGTLVGRATFMDKPESGVRLELYEGMFAFSDASGSFSLKDVPVGKYLLRGSKVRQDGLHLSGEKEIEVKEGSSDMGDLPLDLPSDLYRKVTIDGLMTTDDDEGIWASATAEGFLPLFAVMRVGPYDTHDKVSFVDHVGGEVRAELHFEADWHPDKSVTVAWKAYLYEGTSSDTDDLDESSSNSLVVQEGATAPWSWKMVSDEFGSEDWVLYEFTVRNEMQQT